MKLFLQIMFFLTLLMPVMCHSQVKYSETSITPGEDFLMGEVSRESLQAGEFGGYFKSEYINYQPCNAAIQQIQKEIYGCSIVIVLATWCHDSQTQLGRFYKILDLLDYNTNLVTTICLDRDKRAGETDISKYNVTLVPTFIFFKNGSESGRIIESPKRTLENDIVQILNK
jgi:hypothetical protein